MDSRRKLNRLQTRADWGDTVPATNFAIGSAEFFFYSLLTAATVGGIATSNIIQFHANSHATINPMSEWRNPLALFKQRLEENPLEGAVLTNLVVGVGCLLLVWMLARIAYTSGSWARDRLS